MFDDEVDDFIFVWLFVIVVFDDDEWVYYDGKEYVDEYKWYYEYKIEEKKRIKDVIGVMYFKEGSFF